MLPRATSTRTTREATAGKVGGRTQEIQRLIGRSLRSVVKLEELGERTIWLDCDVLQADGGTRTASISGAFVALVLALDRLKQAGTIKTMPVSDYVAATSVGIIAGTPMLDLAYEEDSRAEVDMNVVQTGGGRFIEVQGTAETTPFDRAGLDALLALAEKGIRELVGIQRSIVGATSLGTGPDPREELGACPSTPCRFPSPSLTSSQPPTPTKFARFARMLDGVPYEIVGLDASRRHRGARGDWRRRSKRTRG